MAINSETNRKVVFFGNGLNQVDGGINWNKLLKDLTKKNGDACKNVPNISSNTLRYELIFSSRHKHPMSSTTENDIDKDLKENVIKDIKYLQESKSRCGSSYGEIYKSLALLPVTDYITTNYDHSLEIALIEDEVGYEKDGGDCAEGIYNIHRYNQFRKGDDVKRIWHIHGDVEKWTGIMLGYEHYCKELSRIVNYVRGFYQGKKKKIPSITKRLQSGYQTFNIESWIDHFFVSDIHFVGYGLDMSEIDVWWLLTKRMRLIREREITQQNTITFHSCDASEDLIKGMFYKLGC